MRWSSAFIPTTRESPADSTSKSHQLLVRAGYVRPVGSGIYSLLPLAIRVRERLSSIVREEMNAIGAQEFLLSSLSPSDIWKKSQRWESMGEIMFKLKDRRGSELALGVTHEEIFALIASKHLSSHRQLPQIWYQFQTKFRDEPRPRGGLLRVREFTMKDSYSFDIDESGLNQAFEKHRQAYCEIFSRCGVPYVMAEASTGIMGGADSTEFLLLSESGEDRVAICDGCGYTANLEKAVALQDSIDDGSDCEKLERFSTPGVRTIAQLAAFEGGVEASRQIKTLVYRASKELVVVLLRGDHELNESRLIGSLEVEEVSPATPEEIQSRFGAQPGSLGAVAGALPGDKPVILADRALLGRYNMQTGANQDDFHYRGVSTERDIQVSKWDDFRLVENGDSCITCKRHLRVAKCLEIGHIFKLGTRYSEAFNAQVADSGGAKRSLVMGSYGIGIERLMAAIVEVSHDDNGIIWPSAVAPFQVLVTPVNSSDASITEAATSIYESLRAAGMDVLLDDREERAGVKFNDGDLIGVPVRITVGKKVAEGNVEIKCRKTGKQRTVRIGDVAAGLRAFT